ncbi:12705_t:CDS:2 [Entrophospora sp. SA101]|nr:12705_t:CDS:2 [Entrophospora sp. SA101]CAJ0895840.1 3578_t:CDS:2 [Entrophospora sp. SA101]
MFSSLLPKQSSSLAPLYSNINNNRVELPSIEGLGHNSHNNFIFPNVINSFTTDANSNNLIDSLTSNYVSVTATLSNNNIFRRNMTNNINDIDDSSFYHYNNKNDCHQNDDDNEVVEGDEVMEEVIINDNNEIGNYIPIQYNFKSIPDYPDYDLCVTIRVCPNYFNTQNQQETVIKVELGGIMIVLAINRKD